MMKTARQHLEAHLIEFPRCKPTTCPHTRNFMITVFLNSGRDFVVTAQGFDEESAIAASREGLTRDTPFTAKQIWRMKAEVIPPEMASVFNLPPRE